MPGFERVNVNENVDRIQYSSTRHGDIMSAISEVIVEREAAARQEHQKHLLKIIHRLRDRGHNDDEILKIMSMKEDSEEKEAIEVSVWTRTLPALDPPPKSILDKAERHILDAIAHNWPEDEWVELNSRYDLNMYYRDGERRAAIYAIVNGDTKTNAWYTVEVKQE